MTTADEPRRADGDLLSHLTKRIIEHAPELGDLVLRIRERDHPGERERAQPEPDVETPQEARERRERALAYRRAQWEARRPLMYANAALSDLHPDEQHQGRIRGWLGSNSRALVLWSERPGTGKTHAAYAVGNAAVGHGLHVIAYTATDLNAALRPDGDPGAWEAIVRCDLLILDDLGREHDTGWTQEQLHRALDARVREHKRTVVTTNLEGRAMLERYGDPIVDRLVDGALIVKFTGQSRRRPAPW